MSKDLSDVTEKEVQGTITKWLAKQPNLWFTKTMQMNSNGVPDILVCCNGCFIALEVKRPKGGRLSALQKIQIEAINGAGGTAVVVTSLDEVIDIISKTYNADEVIDDEVVDDEVIDDEVIDDEVIDDDVFS